MFDLDLTIDSSDDAQFLRLITEIIVGAAITHRPPEVRIFKIDHWFDHKWLGFSGKSLIGHWSKQLTVPPFVKNRIVRQWHYVFDESRRAYELLGAGENIHHQGRSERNFYRHVNQIAPASALFWYSGDTAKMGRGSLMGYIPTEEEHWPWYMAFAREKEWNVARRVNIDEREIRAFLERAQSVGSPS